MSIHEDSAAQFEAAHPTTNQQPAEPPAPPPVPPSITENEDEYPEPEESNEPGLEPIDFEELESALKSLSPDCAEKTWVAYRIGPLANAAKAHPHLEQRLSALAVDWSSGKLRGAPSKTWRNAGEHGPARLRRLNSVWQKFRHGKFTRTPVSLRTIFFHAREQGWTGERG